MPHSTLYKVCPIEDIELLQDICEKLGKTKNELRDEMDDFTNLERWVYQELPQLFGVDEVMRKHILSHRDHYLA